MTTASSSSFASSWLQSLAPGTLVWHADDTFGWVQREVHSVNEKGVAIFKNGEVVNVKTEALRPKNPKVLDGVEDMIALSHLNEAALLHNIECRYKWDLMYTNVGDLLVAVNPYKRLRIFTQEMVKVYSSNMAKAPDGSRLAPHIFSVADASYRSLIRDTRSQSLIISGESGAGKTETTKFVMTYLATIGGREGVGELERQILETNPILESFGNAKTLRNDNSSRFGKFIQIMFDPSGIVAGTIIRNYLLEKSRLITQAHGERNYHIFYLLCCGASEQQRKDLSLLPMTEFSIINGSGCFEATTAYPNNETDAEYFPTIIKAMKHIGIGDEELDQIIRTVAGLLHLGNVSFSSASGDDDVASCIDISVLEVASNLLSVDKGELLQSLCTKRIQSAGEVIVTPRRSLEAGQSRDALAKAIYRYLFDWLVQKINQSLASRTDAVNFIGLLDIFGFESFEVNSFEQLCINYANEKLQKFFNDNVLEAEQREYIAEEITWSYIDFKDNQPCLDLIEKKPTGILPLLDEECLLGSAADDDSLWTKLANQNSKHEYFATARFSRRGFSIKHYAGSVEYDVTGFLDKNNDVLHQDLSSIMLKSRNTLLHSLFRDATALSSLSSSDSSAKPALISTPVKRATSGVGGISSAGKPRNARPFLSVGGQFKDQLVSLMESLRKTCPYFVRCIKPNPEKVADKFDKKAVVDQLRNGGVVEAVKVTQAGFPTRFLYKDLYESMNYKVMLPQVQRRVLDPREGMATILKNLGFDPKGYQFGKTKLFFRVGVLAQLDDQRLRLFSKAAIVIQKIFRGFSARAFVRRVRASLRLQSAVKMVIKRAEFGRHSAGITVESKARRVLRRSEYSRMRIKGVAIQSVIRGHFARVLARETRKRLVAAQLLEAAMRRLPVRERMRRRLAVDTLVAGIRGWEDRRGWVEMIEAAEILSSGCRRGIWRRKYCGHLREIHASRVVCRAALLFLFQRRCYKRKVIHSVYRLQCSLRVALAKRQMTRQRAGLALTPAARAYFIRLYFVRQHLQSFVLAASARRCVHHRHHHHLISTIISAERLQAYIRKLHLRNLHRSKQSAASLLSLAVSRTIKSRNLHQLMASSCLQAAARCTLHRNSYVYNIKRDRTAKVLQAKCRRSRPWRWWTKAVPAALVLEAAVFRLLRKQWYSGTKEQLKAESAAEDERRKKIESDRMALVQAKKDREAIDVWKRSVDNEDEEGIHDENGHNNISNEHNEHNDEKENHHDHHNNHNHNKVKVVMLKDIGSAPKTLTHHLLTMQRLGVAELITSDGNLQPEAPTLRRQYIRWLVGTNEVMFSDPTMNIPRSNPEYCTAPAFDDVPPDDPDFDVIQGMAESGLLHSRLLELDHSSCEKKGSHHAKFRPNDVLTREEMVEIKVALDMRGHQSSLKSEEEEDVEGIVQQWKFRDASSINRDCRPYVLADAALGSHSTIRRCLFTGLLFLPSKPVSRCEAVCSLLTIGTGLNNPVVSAADVLSGSVVGCTASVGVLDRLRSKCSDLERCQHETEAEKEGLLARIQNLEHQIESLGDTEETLQNEIVGFKDCETALRSEITSLHAEITSMEALSQSHHEESQRSLQLAQEATNSALERLAESEQRRQEESDAAAARLEATESRLNERARQLEEARRKLADQLEKNEEYIEELQKKLHEAEEEIKRPKTPPPWPEEAVIGHALAKIIATRLGGPLSLKNLDSLVNSTLSASPAPPTDMIRLMFFKEERSEKPQHWVCGFVSHAEAIGSDVEETSLPKSEEEKNRLLGQIIDADPSEIDENSRDWKRVKAIVARGGKEAVWWCGSMARAAGQGKIKQELEKLTSEYEAIVQQQREKMQQLETQIARDKQAQVQLTTEVAESREEVKQLKLQLDSSSKNVSTIMYQTEQNSEALRQSIQEAVQANAKLAASESEIAKLQRRADDAEKQVQSLKLKELLAANDPKKLNAEIARLNDLLKQAKNSAQESKVRYSALQLETEQRAIELKTLHASLEQSEQERKKLELRLQGFQRSMNMQDDLIRCTRQDRGLSSTESTLELEAAKRKLREEIAARTTLEQRLKQVMTERDSLKLQLNRDRENDELASWERTVNDLANRNSNTNNNMSTGSINDKSFT